MAGNSVPDEGLRGLEPHATVQAEICQFRQKVMNLKERKLQGLKGRRVAGKGNLYRSSRPV